MSASCRPTDRLRTATDGGLLSFNSQARSEERPDIDATQESGFVFHFGRATYITAVLKNKRREEIMSAAQVPDGTSETRCICGYPFAIVAQIGTDQKFFREGQKVYINLNCPECGRRYALTGAINGPVVNPESN
jgi:hypothetical protein